MLTRNILFIINVIVSLKYFIIIIMNIIKYKFNLQIKKYINELKLNL